MSTGMKQKKKKVKEQSLDPGVELLKYGGSYLGAAYSQHRVGPALTDSLLSHSILAGGVEKRPSLPMAAGERQAKKKRRELRQATAGAGWFGMTAPEVTPEVAQGFTALRLRGAADAKRFYKKADREGAPTHFQLARVVDNPIDFFHARVPRRQRKRTLVEELLADATLRSYAKRKVQEIVALRAAGRGGRKGGGQRKRQQQQQQRKQEKKQRKQKST